MSRLPLLGVFMLSLSALMLEIISMRASAVAFGLEFYFLLIPLALLGIGIGALLVFIFDVTPKKSIVAAFGYMTAAPVTFLLAHLHIYMNTVLCMALFFIADLLIYVAFGYLIAGVFKLGKFRAALVYSVDLFGAALGAISASILLNSLQYEGAVFLAVCLSAIAGGVFVYLSKVRGGAVLATVPVAIFALLALSLPTETFSIACKELGPTTHTRSNAYSQIDVFEVPIQKMQVTGLAKPDGRSTTYALSVDCNTFVSTLITAPSLHELTFLKHTLRSMPFAYQEKLHGSAGEVLVGSAGAGIDVLRAKLFGASQVDATELNPNMVFTSKLLSSTSTYAYGLPDVDLHVEDTRRFLATSDSQYDLIVLMSAGLFGSVGGGDTPSYSVTVESMVEALAHVRTDGVLVFGSKFGMGTQRQVEEALKATGLSPESRVALLSFNDDADTVALAKRTPFTALEIRTLQDLAAENGYTVSFNKLPHTYEVTSALTDNRPYPLVWSSAKMFSASNMLSMLSMVTLVSAIALYIVALLLLLPLRKELQLPVHAAVAVSLFAASVGFGFTYFQLGVVEKLFLMLAEPSYAVSITLAVFLLCGGVGSLLAGMIPRRYVFWGAVLAVLAISLSLLLGSLYIDKVTSGVLAQVFAVRAAAACLLLALPACAAGLLFAVGLLLWGDVNPKLTPYIWAVDGLFGVVGGIAARLLFHSYGLHTMYIAVTLSYGIALISLGVAYRLFYGAGRRFLV